MIISWTCALLLAAPLASAGLSDPAVESPTELSSALSLSSDAEEAAVMVDGFLRVTRLDASSGSPVADASLGTKVDHARLRLAGEVADFSWRFGVDALDSALSIQDAWISHELSDETELTFGNFRPPFLGSGLLDADRLFFPRRTRNGTFFSVRSPGVQASGDEGRIGWTAAVQDGVLDPSDQIATLRLSYDFTGRGELPWEGALRSDFDSRFWAAAAVSKEDALDSDLARAVELHYVVGRYSFSIEWLGYGSGYDSEDDLGPWSPTSDPTDFVWGERRGATHPLSLTATYMFVPDSVEFAMRWEDFDDVRGAGFSITGDEADVDFDRKNLYLGFNYYIDGHDMKGHLGYLHETRDGVDDADDLYAWGAGFSLSF